MPLLSDRALLGNSDLADLLIGLARLPGVDQVRRLALAALGLGPFPREPSPLS